MTRSDSSQTTISVMKPTVNQISTPVPATSPVVNRRHFAYDWLKAIAILGVVYIHTSVMVTNFLPIISNHAGWLMVTYGNAFFRWSVPVFVMTSGALLLSREYLNTGLFYKRRLWRIGVPLVFWTLIYEFARSGLVPGEVFHLQWIIHRVLAEQPYQHIYFLVILLGLMVVTPWLSRLVRSISRQDLLMLTGLFLFIGMMYFNKSKWAVAIFIPYIGYYLAGYLMKDLVLSKKQWFGVGLSMSLIASFMTLTTFIDSKVVNILNDVTRPYVSEFAYLSPFVMALGLMAFVFFRQPRLVRSIGQNDIFARMFDSIGQRSLGIYMLHPILLLMAYAWFSNLSELQQQNPVLVTLPLWFGVCALSWGLSVAFRRVPFLGWLV